MGLTVHVSYRRASSEVKRIRGQSSGHTTVHRRLQEFAADHDPFGPMKDRAFRFLVVDGTKVHLQGALGQELGQVEMRWALASLGGASRFEPVGVLDRSALGADSKRPSGPYGLRQTRSAVL